MLYKLARSAAWSNNFAVGVPRSGTLPPIR
jgi:hypothetical protein